MQTFFKSVIDSVIELFCLIVGGGAMLIGIFIYAVILTPIAAGFVLWLIANKAYKKIFS